MTEKSIIKQGRTNAIISYFWVIGTLIAFVLNSKKRNSFVSFHIRQMLGLNVLWALNQWFIYKYLGTFSGRIIVVILFVFWIIGFTGVVNNQEKEIPIFGKLFQQWFNDI